MRLLIKKILYVFTQAAARLTHLFKAVRAVGKVRNDSTADGAIALQPAITQRKLSKSYSAPDTDPIPISMIPVDFFGCKREQIVACSWEEACDRLPCAGITLPDASALTLLSEALTGSCAFSARPVPLSTEPFLELSNDLLTVVREASVEDLKDAGARWAQLSPWKLLDSNPMDLAGFLLHLHSLVHGPGRDENSIFLLVDSGSCRAS
jgi:hypothetical protein